jgi:hypothetical protein
LPAGYWGPSLTVGSNVVVSAQSFQVFSQTSRFPWLPTG